MWNPSWALRNVLYFLRFASSYEILCTDMNDAGNVEIVCFKFGEFSCHWLKIDFCAWITKHSLSWTLGTSSLEGRCTDYHCELSLALIICNFKWTFNNILHSAVILIKYPLKLEVDALVDLTDCTMKRLTETIRHYSVAWKQIMSPARKNGNSR